MTLALSTWLLWLRLIWLHKMRPHASLKIKLAALVVLLPLVIYPFSYGPVWWLRGLTGDLSMTTLLLLLAAVYHQLLGNSLVTARENKLILGLVVLVGIVFYPLALGVGQMDPYVWGYASVYMSGTLLALSFAAFFLRFYVFATIVLLCVLAWHIQLLQSVNLWDYLIDPFIFFYALVRLVRKIC